MRILILLFFLCTTTNRLTGQPEFVEKLLGPGQGLSIAKSIEDAGQYILGINRQADLTTYPQIQIINTAGDSLSAITIQLPELKLTTVYPIDKNSFITLGSTPVISGYQTVSLAKINNGGNLLWMSSLPEGYYGSYPRYLSPDIEQGYFLSYYDDEKMGNNRFSVASFDVQGNLIKRAEAYCRRYYSHPTYQTNDGGLASVSVYGDSPARISIKKFDPQLSLEWEKIYWDTTDMETPSHYGATIIQTNDNGYLIAGAKLNYNNIQSVSKPDYLLKLDSNGNHLWSRSNYNLGNHLVWRMIKEDDNGDIFLVGTFEKNITYGFYEIVLMKSNALGEPYWTKTFSGKGYAYPNHFILNEAQQPVIIGTTRDSIHFKEEIYLIMPDDNLNNQVSPLPSPSLFHLFPNPSSAELNIAITKPIHGSGQLTIVTSTGQKVFEDTDIHTNNKTYSIQHLREGMYFVTLTIDQQKFIRKLIITAH